MLFTANDAYMRDFHLVVPARLRGLEHRGGERYALDQMGKVLKADVRPSAEISFKPEPQAAEALPRSVAREV